MSLRDFNSPSQDRPIVLNTEPLGNGSGLGNFHTVNPEEREPNNTPKILAGLVVALMVGAAGAYIYSVTPSSSVAKPMVADNKLPSPPQPAAPAPQPAADTAATPAPMPEATPAAAPAPEVATPVPVKTASAKPAKSKTVTDKATTDTASAEASGASARMAADSTQVSQQPQQQEQAAIQPVEPQQQAAVTPVEPVSPQAPASSVASNQQATAPSTAATASDMPQPGTQVQPSTAPAQDQQTGATPVPAPQQ